MTMLYLFVSSGCSRSAGPIDGVCSGATVPHAAKKIMQVPLLHYITPTTHFVAVISGSVLYDSNRMCCVGAIRQPQFHPHGRHGNKAVYGDGLELAYVRGEKY